MLFFEKKPESRNPLVTIVFALHIIMVVSPTSGGNVLFSRPALFARYLLFKIAEFKLFIFVI